MTTEIIIALIVILIIIVTASHLLARRRIQEIHVLVNRRLEVALQEVKRLTAEAEQKEKKK